MKPLLNKGFECYIIGGAVRDYFLRIKPHDYDLFTNATGEQILNIFPKGRVLGGEERQTKILTVMVGDVEVSQYRANGNRTEVGKRLEDHQWTCDCYSNALAWNIKGELCGDKTITRCGQEDIKKGIIRAVGNPDERIQEDQIRIKRFIRLSNRYDWDISPQTLLAMKKGISDLFLLPKERIRDELLKILPYGQDWLGSLGIWNKLIPQNKLCYNLDGGKNHKEPVHIHSNKTYDIMRTITNNPFLLLAARVHDIGKSVTAKEIDGNMTFHNHEMEGYKIIKKFMNKYKFSKDEINYVTTLIRCHMYDTKMSKKGYCNLFKRLEDNKVPVEHLLMLRYADSQGNLSVKRYKWAEKSNLIVKKYYQYKYAKEPFRVTDLEINGYEIMNFGYKGKNIRVCLELLLNLVQEGLIRNNKSELILVLKIKQRLIK